MHNFFVGVFFTKVP